MPRGRSRIFSGRIAHFVQQKSAGIFYLCMPNPRLSLLQLNQQFSPGGQTNKNLVLPNFKKGGSSNDMLKEVRLLLYKEFLLESRQKQSINGLILYLISTIFVCKMCFRSLPEPSAWNALFWIILLFASINASSKSFMQDSRARFVYMYTMASPQAIILAKISYNTILLIVLSLIGFVVYIILLGGNPIQNMPLFLTDVLLGSMGFSAVLTSMSAIAARTNNSFTLMAILSFPLLLPLIMTVVKISKNAIDGLDPSISYKYLVVLFGLNLISGALSYLLFPYLWKD